jgi:drug/metabolite transporter (DMT)-like permease
MDILKTANIWAKDEIFSSTFFILFGVLFVLATIGFWQLGKSEMARAFIFPSLVAGILLLIIGFGLVYTNKSRIKQFTNAYHQDAAAFVQAELDRAEKTIEEYQTVVFKIIPVIIIISALLILFIDKANWRAICITTLAMMSVILIIDSNAHARMVVYKKQLELVKETDLKN